MRASILLFSILSVVAICSPFERDDTLLQPRETLEAAFAKCKAAIYERAAAEEAALFEQHHNLYTHAPVDKDKDKRNGKEEGKIPPISRPLQLQRAGPERDEMRSKAGAEAKKTAKIEEASQSGPHVLHPIGPSLTHKNTVKGAATITEGGEHPTGVEGAFFVSTTKTSAGAERSRAVSTKRRFSLSSRTSSIANPSPTWTLTSAN